MTISSKKVKALLKIGLTVAVLVVVMLASVGAWEIYKGSGLLVGKAHADGLFPFLKCYALKPDLLPLQKPLGKVVLLDEVRPDGERAAIGPAQLLCVPAKALTK